MYFKETSKAINLLEFEINGVNLQVLQSLKNLASGCVSEPTYNMRLKHIQHPNQEFEVTGM